MQRRIRSGMLAAAGMLGAAAAFLGAPQSAQAVPSFARQTGLACEACHTVFPELTPFGRRFKLNGYVLTTKQQVSDIDQQKHSTLSLSDLPPLSVMLQASSTWWNKPIADTNSVNDRSQNGATQFPQQLSLFYAGKIADHLGAFFQMTYQQTGDKLSIDNSEIRFADHTGGNDFIYGLTLNNAVSVSDLWNDTPTWGAPFFTPGVGATVAAAPLMYNLGSGTVAGVGAYTMYKDAFYFEVDGYRSALKGQSLPYDSGTVNGNGVIQQFAPYWRAAYEKNWGPNSFEVGTEGLWSKYQPSTGNTNTTLSNGNADTYLDLGLDSQYQYIGDNHIFSVLASFMHESHDINAANGNGNAGRTLDLNRTQVTGSYFYHRKFGGSIGIVHLNGTADTTAFGPAATNGSATGSPNTQYEVLEADYLPWLNTKLALQYTMYNWFNGSTGSYDGVTARNASDNNTLMLGMWTAF